MMRWQEPRYTRNPGKHGAFFFTAALWCAFRTVFFLCTAGLWAPFGTMTVTDVCPAGTTTGIVPPDVTTYTVCGLLEPGQVMVSTNAPAAVVELVVTVTAVAGGAWTTTFWVTLTTMLA